MNCFLMPGQVQELTEGRGASEKNMPVRIALLEFILIELFSPQFQQVVSRLNLE